MDLNRDREMFYCLPNAKINNMEKQVWRLLNRVE